jgi:transcriptional regulator with XRE-family HTH domain
MREYRVGRYTVDELASRASVSAGLISQLERGHGNPSFVTLLKLSQALDMPLGALFETEDGRADRMIVRRNERPQLRLGEALGFYELLTPDLAHRLAVMRTIIPAGFDNSPRPLVHAGEECIWVVKGRLEGHVGVTDFVLEAGDSITFDSGLPHWWRNRTTSDVEIYGAMTPPSL